MMFWQKLVADVLKADKDLRKPKRFELTANVQVRFFRVTESGKSKLQLFGKIFVFGICVDSTNHLQPTKHKTTCCPNFSLLR